jgi:hypothetical protein
MKFKIKKIVTSNEKTIDVTLEKSDRRIYLKVGPLYVFTLQNDGTGRLCGGLEGNNHGLQTTTAGKLKLEKN